MHAAGISAAFFLIDAMMLAHDILFLDYSVSSLSREDYDYIGAGCWYLPSVRAESLPEEVICFLSQRKLVASWASEHQQNGFCHLLPDVDHRVC